MKKYIYSVMAFFTLALCSAQVALTQAEYFWDTDPGQGLGVAVTAVDGSFNSAFEQLSKTGIAAPSVGLHRFSIRVKDNTNVWGPVFSNVIYVQPVVTPTVISISQAECFWDTDPGEGNATALLATDGSFNSAFEQFFKNGVTIAQPIGLHVFNVRVKDNTGVWGPVFRNVVNIQSVLSNEDFNRSTVLVYPNPVKNRFTVENAGTITMIKLYDIKGVLVKTITTGFDAAIDITNLQSGVYLLQITDDKGSIFSERLIKE